MLKLINPCGSCLGIKWGNQGFVPPSGSGDNGVLVVAEAPGENEAIDGIPLIGKAGYFLWNNLKKAGIERDGFRVANVLSCRPPDNKLAKMPYEAEVIGHCSPLLDNEIASMRKHALAQHKTFVIVTLGKISFKRIMGIDEKHPIMHESYLNYPLWHEGYQAWVIAADHPSYLMRGKSNLIPLLQFAFKRALEISRDGLRLDEPEYLLDPEAGTFDQWVKDYKRYASNNEAFLSYDIETPYKSGKEEDEVSKEEEGDDYTILRCSFSYRPNEAVSVPWHPNYLPALIDIFATPFPKVNWNGNNYDDPRITAQMPINGDRNDAMLAWHVLNSSLPKSLGFVTPYYCQSTSMWKHLSASQPAFYNAKDADMALRNWLGIRDDLKKNNLWNVFDRHVTQMNRVFGYMSQKGVLLDAEMRKESEGRLAELLKETESQMEASVPVAAKKLKIYKKLPKSTDGLSETVRDYPVKCCLACGELKPRKSHEKFCPKLNLGTIDLPQTIWTKPLPFKISKQSLLGYQGETKHKAIYNKKEQKITFNEDAIMRLMKKYPEDKLYPLILEKRELQTLLTRYIGVTQYQRITVDDDYELQEGEKLAL